MMPTSTVASTAAASTATHTTTTTPTTTNTAASTAAAQPSNKMVAPTSTYNSRVKNSMTASTNISTSTSATMMKTTATTTTKSAASSAQCSTAPVVSSVISTKSNQASSLQPNNPDLSHNKGSSNLTPTGPTMASVVSKKVNPISLSASNVQSATTTAVTIAAASQSSNSNYDPLATTTAPTAAAQHASSTRIIASVPDPKSPITSSTSEAHQTLPVATSSPSKSKTATMASSGTVNSTGAENNSGNSQSNNTNNSVILPNAPKTSKLSVVNGSLSSDHSRASTDGHGTPSVDNISKTNLYIKGLQTTTNDQDLYEMCVRFGQISSTKAIIDKSTGCCRGYGFVEFTSPQAAEMAVQELIKEGVQAQMAKISPSYSTHSNNNSHHHHHHHHHHHNQYHHVNRGQMHHHHNSHQGHGNSNNNNTGGSGGTNNNNNSGQHQHSSGYNVTSAYQHNQNSSQGNSSGHNNSSHHNPDPTNLYIANLPPNMSEQELENLLSTYGPVVSTRILRDQNTNVPRGVGFARMESRDKCEQIIEQLNGRPCKGCQEPLLVKFADGGSKKRNYHNSLHHHNNSGHHRTQKSHQDDTRWRENAPPVDLGGIPSFEHQSNISHSNHLTDLAMMGPMAYHARMPIFPPAMQAGSGYPNPMGPQTNAPPWLHPGGHSQPYVIPQPIIPPGGLTSSNQAATMQYGHIPQLTSQMQGLQIAHQGAPVTGYLTPQHQWSQP